MYIERDITPTLPELLGEETATEGVLVCTSVDECPLPGGNRVIPWQAFPTWISSLPGLG